MDNYKFFQRESTPEAAMATLNLLRTERLRAFVDEDTTGKPGYVISVHESDMDKANTLIAKSLYQDTKNTQQESVVDQGEIDKHQVDQKILSHISKAWIQAERVIDMSYFELGPDAGCEERMGFLIEHGIVEYQGDRLDFSACEVRVTLKPLKAVGFWNSDEVEHYIHPEQLVAIEQIVDKDKLVAYLESGEVFQSWLGDGDCQLGCGEDELSTTDLTDGVWLWPQSLSHYIEEHNVVLPDQFLEHVKKNNWQVPYVCLPEATEEDDAFWIEYCESVLSDKP